ncbi:hypothetical protein BD309DRAFT_961508 [Dichomitus squalens]|uniref:Uncharacterized protein n=1 Tax=Dichomitus squalens TaxID=114155 RepID=A0A4Q9NNM2_9APHY|nr:hypothetical protein BD311DRAFT_770903 [Dichomitus squalens]TBU43089.1 hypothetical protein BD309DRAFT_961508 [Dichomitus squalens]
MRSPCRAPACSRSRAHTVSRRPVPVLALTRVVVSSVQSALEVFFLALESTTGEGVQSCPTRVQNRSNGEVGYTPLAADFADS